MSVYLGMEGCHLGFPLFPFGHASPRPTSMDGVPSSSPAGKVGCQGLGSLCLVAPCCEPTSPGLRWARSPSPSKHPGLMGGCYLLPKWESAGVIPTPPSSVLSPCPELYSRSSRGALTHAQGSAAIAATGRLQSTAAKQPGVDRACGHCHRLSCVQW